MAAPEQPSAPSRGGAGSAKLRPARGFLERFGLLYEHPIRLSILAELYMREMSPKQYYEQVGGSSYASVRRHFKTLAEDGWLRMVRTAPLDGPGRPEHLYRATELAVLDDEPWSEIPVSIRDAFTIPILEDVARSFGTAATAGTLSGGEEVAGFDRLLVDEAGWREAIDVLNSGFRSLTQEQTDAKIRLDTSHSAPALLVVMLAGFELAAAAPPDQGAAARLPTAQPRRDAPDFGHRLSKVLTDRRNLEIVAALNAEPMSPSQLYERFGGASVEGFDHRCKQLAKLGWAVKVGELSGGSRRGATENFYRAALPPISELQVYAPIPPSARRGAIWEALDGFFREALAAVRAGTFNRRDERHLTLSPLLVDGLGRSQVAGTLEAMREHLARIHQESRARLGTRAGREVGALVTSFETPLSERF